MPLETRPFDPANYLETDEDIALYLDAAMEGGDANHFKRALEAVSRARGLQMTIPASPTLDTLMRVLSASGLRLRVDRLAA